MEKIILFRMFLTFPLVGLLLPDISEFALENFRQIPESHRVIDLVLVISILICQASILISKRKNLILVDSIIGKPTI